MKLSDYTHSLENSTLFVTASNYSKKWERAEYVIVGSREQDLYYSDIEVRDGALYIGKHYAGDLPEAATIR